ncbi:hypothetical protein QP547_03475 [Weeksella virosa]|uniref:hypothetical protein n=1 Tax=Weeksella virosa TaxID=1014 RepID=UPI002555AA24|nr:hypothetical protein [Weeksella virosa]MDK7674868.1 hypothetical protein [Weeksella virosa]
MQILEANITDSAIDYLKCNLKGDVCLEEANDLLFNSFGILNFFETEEELKNLINAISESQNIVSEPDRTEYGDFQTNLNLANNVAEILVTKNSLPQIIIEPTCGKGNFILASLQKFQNVEKIYGIEIYKPYIWECKFNIIDFYLQYPKENKPVISIIHSSVFDYNFKQLAKENTEKEILIIGNPPWVTNSQLGSLNSSNLPKKRNFKNHNGLDAITGKGNFDIAEFITINLIETFQKMKGQLALLVKNSVIKNIVYDQRNNKFEISEIKRYYIDCKKEFNVSVEASLFICKLNSKPEFECEELNLYNSKNADRTKARSKRRFEERKRFGWIKRKFVSNIDTYFDTQQIDGICPFEWRQGIKHDCSSIMELDKVNGHFINGLKDKIELEQDLVYGLLKSSDLKNTVISESRKFTIVTQKKVGQETNYIKYDYPKTYQYLTEHQEAFNGRKSSIYNNKPPFSIFGVGDYSFKPYKVAISGLYKTFHFTLVLPQNEKPLMLDDTCYFLGFDNLEFAVYTLLLLNSETNIQFLQSITFSDAKRTFTKDVLMRIDLLKLAENIEISELQTTLNEINEFYNFNLTLDLWEDFIEEMQPIKSGQMKLF